MDVLCIFCNSFTKKSIEILAEEIFGNRQIVPF